MKKILTILTILMTLSILVKAELKPGMMILGQFNNNPSTIFIAYVTAVNGEKFTCRFVQSNAEYVFSSATEGEGIVVSNKGGKYPKGTQFVFVEYKISDDAYSCILNKTPNHEVIAKFPDGKSFLGNITEFTEDGGFNIVFMHSGSKYTFDKNGVVLSQTGGAYKKGTPIKIFCAEIAGPVPVGMTLPKVGN
jgi:hypothetical protein